MRGQRGESLDIDRNAPAATRQHDAVWDRVGEAPARAFLGHEDLQAALVVASVVHRAQANADPEHGLLPRPRRTVPSEGREVVVGGCDRVVLVHAVCVDPDVAPRRRKCRAATVGSKRRRPGLALFVGLGLPPKMTSACPCRLLCRASRCEHSGHGVAVLNRTNRRFSVLSVRMVAPQLSGKSGAGIRRTGDSRLR